MPTDWFFPVTIGFAAAFLALGLILGWRATMATEPERSRFWSYCGIASCGLWAEIILIIVMLTLRAKG